MTWQYCGTFTDDTDHFKKCIRCQAIKDFIKYKQCGACKFFEDYTCRRHAPVGVKLKRDAPGHDPVWPPVAVTMSCGDWTIKEFYNEQTTVQAELPVPSTGSREQT